MTDEELLAELVLHALPRYERLQKRDKLTDEEWWEKIVNTMPDLEPDLFKELVEQKEKMLLLRKTMMSTPAEELARQWSKEILPFVVEARSEEKLPRRLTKKQVERAIRLKSKAAARRAAELKLQALEADLAALKSALGWTEDPLLREGSKLDQSELEQRTAIHLQGIEDLMEEMRKSAKDLR